MVGDEHRDRGRAVAGDASSVVANGRSACTTTTRTRPRRATHRAPGVGRARRASRDRRAARARARRTTRATSGALDTTTTVAAPAAATTRVGHALRERDAGVVVEGAGEARLAERNDRSGTTIPASVDGACRRVGLRRAAWHGVRMLPAVDAVYSGAKGLFYPALRYGLRWTIEGEERIPRSGPVILASNHISYLDPLTLAYVADRRRRRLRFLAKAELFDKRGLGPLLRAAHQIPVQRGTTNAADALDAAVDALRRGECVAVFPEGTISLDLEPMAGKSGTARLARRPASPVTPVGLWGSHRIMFKGRKPHWRWGVAEVGRRRQAGHGRARRTREGRDRPHHAARSATCVARAREIYPQHPRRAKTTGGRAARRPRSLAQPGAPTA